MNKMDAYTEIPDFEINKIYCCDCVEFMRKLPDECVDLIYADPPFYGRKFFNENKNLNEYLEWSKLWLRETKRIMLTTASIYIHCDPIFSHYLKIIMDEIFEIDNFRNEIVWRIGWLAGFKTRKKGWIRNHDIILYYVKSDNFTFNKEYISYPDGYIRRDGSLPKGQGIPIEDTWNCHKADKLNSIMIMSFSKEKIGIPTQKPETLLRRIIRASSKENDLVFDPFMGSGTTAIAAKRLGRNFLGCEINPEHVKLANKRVEDEQEIYQRTTKVRKIIE